MKNCYFKLFLAVSLCLFSSIVKAQDKLIDSIDLNSFNSNLYIQTHKSIKNSCIILLGLSKDRVEIIQYNLKTRGKFRHDFVYNKSVDILLCESKSEDNIKLLVKNKEAFLFKFEYSIDKQVASLAPIQKQMSAHKKYLNAIKTPSVTYTFYSGLDKNKIFITAIDTLLNYREIEYSLSSLPSNISSSNIQDYIKEASAISQTENIDLEKLGDNKKLFFEDNSLFIVNNLLNKSAELIRLNLSNNIIEYKLFDREAKWCEKEPNGIFCSNTYFLNGKLYSTVACRHNLNIFIHDANSTNLISHNSLEVYHKTNSPSNLMLENYFKKSVDTLENLKTLLSNIPYHPIFIASYPTKNNNTQVLAGTYQLEKKLKIGDLLSVALLGFQMPGIIGLPSYILGTPTIVGFRYNDKIVTAKYASVILNNDNSSINHAATVTQNLYSFSKTQSQALSNIEINEKKYRIASDSGVLNIYSN